MTLGDGVLIIAFCVVFVAALTVLVRQAPTLVDTPTTWKEALISVMMGLGIVIMIGSIGGGFAILLAHLVL